MTALTCASRGLHHCSETPLDKGPVPTFFKRDFWISPPTAVQGSRSNVAHPQLLFSPEADPPDPREDSPTWRILNFIELDSFYFRALVSPAFLLIHPWLGRRFSQHPLHQHAQTHTHVLNTERSREHLRAMAKSSM